MSKAMAQLEWKGPPPAIFCPACGAAIYADDEEVSDRCAHVLFTYLSDTAEFDYVSPACRSVIEAVLGATADQGQDFVNQVLRRLNSTSVLGLAITTKGMACGPVGSTVCVAVDFMPKAQALEAGDD